MISVQINKSKLVASRLDVDLRASLGGAISGISYDGTMVSVWFYNQPTSEQQTTAQNIIDNHDPVFISSNKQAINNTGNDIATITLFMPYNITNVTQLTATVEGQNTSPLSLTNNEATFEVDGLDLIDGDTIEIGVVSFSHTPISLEVTS